VTDETLIHLDDTAVDLPRSPAGFDPGLDITGELSRGVGGQVPQDGDV
jgi:hypothetical protein